MMTSVETKNLGLAAYIKMQGGLLKTCSNGMFLFEQENERSEHEWEIEYTNSCCHRHDSELMQLRRLIK
jgi:hypothetical protein